MSVFSSCRRFVWSPSRRRSWRVNRWVSIDFSALLAALTALCHSVLNWWRMTEGEATLIITTQWLSWQQQGGNLTEMYPLPWHCLSSSLLFPFACSVFSFLRRGLLLIREQTLRVWLVIVPVESIYETYHITWHACSIVNRLNYIFTVWIL